jgi:Cu/Ag efflux pump CusA
MFFDLQILFSANLFNPREYLVAGFTEQELIRNLAARVYQIFQDLNAHFMPIEEQNQVILEMCEANGISLERANQIIAEIRRLHPI